MDEPMIRIAAPVLHKEFAVWFAAYGFGWGYRAFAISYDTVCDSLGAADTTDAQIRLAFQLGTRQVLQAVQQYGASPYEGNRISLSLWMSCRCRIFLKRLQARRVEENAD
jgi:hypothetical protein